MKTILPSLFLFSILFASCSSKFYVYNIASNQVESNEEELFIFENEDLAMVYDFWTNGGVALFNVYNKRDSTLYLRLDKSSFIVNGISIPYYNSNVDWSPYDDDRYGNAKRMLVIDPMNKKSIEGFPIGYDRSNMNGDKAEKFFFKKDSPFVFTNKIAYAFDALEDDLLFCNNEFWVATGSVMKRKDFIAFDEDFKKSKSDKFYISRQGLSSSFWIQLAFEALNASLIFL